MDVKYVDVIRAMTPDIDDLQQLKNDIEEAALKGKHYCDVSAYNFRAIQWLADEGFEIKVSSIFDGNTYVSW